MFIKLFNNLKKMKINKNSLKILSIALLVFFALMKISIANKSKSFLSLKEKENTKDDVSIQTKMFVIKESFLKIKQNKYENSDVYEKCIDDAMKVTNESAMNVLWDFFKRIPYSDNNYKVDIAPFKNFAQTTMSEAQFFIEKKNEKGETVKFTFNCAKLCDEAIVELEPINKSELYDVLKPYFVGFNMNVNSKNMITAYIGTYRNTDTGRRLIPKLNLYK